MFTKGWPARGHHTLFTDRKGVALGTRWGASYNGLTTQADRLAAGRVARDELMFDKESPWFQCSTLLVDFIGVTNFTLPPLCFIACGSGVHCCCVEA
jgi:hypothetical protein